MIERWFATKYFLHGTVPVLAEIEYRLILVVEYEPGCEIHISSYRLENSESESTSFLSSG